MAAERRGISRRVKDYVLGAKKVVQEALDSADEAYRRGDLKLAKQKYDEADFEHDRMTAAFNDAVVRTQALYRVGPRQKGGMIENGPLTGLDAKWEPVLLTRPEEVVKGTVNGRDSYAGFVASQASGVRRPNHSHGTSSDPIRSFRALGRAARPRDAGVGASS
ncbi:MAG: hypothetical protein HY553_22180 [Elusimicrobia bacterium]|nr:hypothetical protein [Elusimicrobiota bacterium]